MINLQFQTSERLARFLNSRVGGFDMEVGITKDGPAALAKRERAGNLAGGPRNKIAGKSSVSLREVMDTLNTRYNILLAPWRAANNKDIVALIREMAKSGLKRAGGTRRFLNTAQAVVRDPIARGDYGENSPRTEARKGFNRLLINTGKLFSSIKARFVR